MPIPLLILITDLELGGSPVLIRDLAPALARTGRFAPQMVSLKPLPTGPSSIPALLRAANIPVFSLNARHMWELPVVLARLARHIRLHRPQVVLSVLVHANLLASLVRPFCPPFALVHSIHTLQPRPRWHWGVQRLLWADGLIVPSQEILARLKPRLPSFVIPNGIDVKRFFETAPFPSNSLPWPPGSTVVGYIGRFDPVKNLPVLVQAFALLVRNSPANQNLHLALIGHGPQEGLLRQLARELGVAERTHFPGPTTEPERFYKSLSVFCLPSQAEGFGLVVLEALAAGCRLVLADTAVLRSVGGRWAHYVSCLDAKSLATVITEVMNEEPTTLDLEGRRERLERDFSTEGMAQAYAQKLERIPEIFSRQTN